FNRDPGLWSVFAMVKEAADVPAIEQELWRTVDELRSSTVDAQRLSDVRSHMKYQFLSHLSTPNQVCGSLARPLAITRDFTCIDEMYATLDQVTPQDVQRAASLYLGRERSTVAVLHTQGQEIPKSPTSAANGAKAAAAQPKGSAAHKPAAEVASRPSGKL